MDVRHGSGAAMRPRYVVRTVTGYLGKDARTPPYGHTRQQPGLSAHVHDRLDAYRVCGTFRSEDR